LASVNTLVECAIQSVFLHSLWFIALKKKKVPNFVVVGDD